jgi:aminodeoxyfutalosine synthase
MAELFFLAKINRSSVGEIAQRFREAGLKTMTGGGAEILHPDVRPLIARGKLTGEEWLRTAEDAHNNGITSNSTMLYGHLEKAKHRIDHIIKIRELQAKTHGFLSFIPLKFSLPNTELLRSGDVGDPSSAQDDIKVIAVSRLLFGDLLKNIAVYWVSMGKRVAQVALNSGGNDLIGTSFSEKIYKETGRDETISIEELTHLIREAGRVPIQRDTFYNPIRYM